MRDPSVWIARISFQGLFTWVPWETEVKGQNDIKITNCKKHEGNEKGWVVIAGVLKLFLRNRSEPTTLLCQTNTWFESSQQSF